MVTVLKLAVCLFPEVTALDYQGPMELLGFLSKSAQDQKLGPPSPYQIEATYLGYDKNPIVPAAGPRLVADATYEEGNEQQFDIILVPGGMITHLSNPTN